jgi:acetyltransferase-like isoleucine patch superfamily enzyme
MTSLPGFSYHCENFKVLFADQGSTFKIGKFCSIANDVTIFLGGNHPVKWITNYPFGYLNRHIFPRDTSKDIASATNGDVVIGNDVWIGQGVTIMSGVSVGDGATIAANSHVVKNVEPYEVVGGNPSRHIRYKFTPEQIEALLQIQWWEWSVDKINENSQLLCNEDIDYFISMHRITSSNNDVESNIISEE